MSSIFGIDIEQKENSGKSALASNSKTNCKTPRGKVLETSKSKLLIAKPSKRKLSKGVVETKIIDKKKIVQKKKPVIKEVKDNKLKSKAKLSTKLKVKN